jgi:NADH-ubiquinone oxidoreductase chain 5
MFIAGLVASFEFDIKKIIALSTLSQLGVIMFSISLGLYKIAFFHLVAHALFKALLFLCAGSVIHGSHGSQDIRNLGGVTLNYPLVSVLINLSNLSLCGIPFISGFYSKDMVVEFAVQGYWNFFLIIVIYLRLGLTVFYSIRLSFYSFINFPSGFCTKSIGDKDVFIMTPIMCLSLLSLISGPCLSNFLFFPSLVFLDQILKCFVLIIIFRVIIVSFNSFVRAKMESYFIVRNFQGLI